MKTSKLRKPGLVLLVIGVVLLWFSGKDFLTSLKAPVDLNEAGFTADQVEEGMHVKTDIYAALDTFASEETWTENKDGSSTPKETAHQYYIIPVGEMEYMALEIGSSGSQFSTMSAIMDETYAYLTDAAWAPRSCRWKAQWKNWKVSWTNTLANGSPTPCSLAKKTPALIWCII